MGKINVSRLALGGIVAAIVFFVGDAIVNGGILKVQWTEVLKPVGITADDAFHNPLYFAIYDLAKGFIAIWLYAAIRPRLGAGASTAIVAAVIVWALVLPIPMIGLLPMRFFSGSFLAAWAFCALMPIMAGTLAGSWLYRENG
jgi:hypothetical protein